VPLYIYLAWNDVHSPCEAPARYTDLYPNESDAGRKNFSAMITAVDDQVGDSDGSAVRGGIL
jgi:hypothetical protein